MLGMRITGKQINSVTQEVVRISVHRDSYGNIHVLFLLPAGALQREIQIVMLREENHQKVTIRKEEDNDKSVQTYW